jgi:hypothetical protein
MARCEPLTDPFLAGLCVMSAGDVPEATVLESLGAATGPAGRALLEGLPNEEALQALPPTTPG